MTTKKTTRTRAEAKKLMWEYYSENKASLPTWIREFREEILESLGRGEDVDHVFWSIVRSVEQDTSSAEASPQNSLVSIAA